MPHLDDFPQLLQKKVEPGKEQEAFTKRLRLVQDLLAACKNPNTLQSIGGLKDKIIPAIKDLGTLIATPGMAAKHAELYHHERHTLALALFSLSRSNSLKKQDVDAIRTAVEELDRELSKQVDVLITGSERSERLRVQQQFEWTNQIAYVLALSIVGLAFTGELDWMAFAKSIKFEHIKFEITEWWRIRTVTRTDCKEVPGSYQAVLVLGAALGTARNQGRVDGPAESLLKESVKNGVFRFIEHDIISAPTLREEQPEHRSEILRLLSDVSNTLLFTWNDVLAQMAESELASYREEVDKITPYGDFRPQPKQPDELRPNITELLEMTQATLLADPQLADCWRVNPNAEKFLFWAYTDNFWGPIKHMRDLDQIHKNHDFNFLFRAAYVKLLNALCENDTMRQDILRALQVHDGLIADRSAFHWPDLLNELTLPQIETMEGPELRFLEPGENALMTATLRLLGTVGERNPEVLTLISPETSLPGKLFSLLGGPVSQHLVGQVFTTLSQIAVNPAIAREIWLLVGSTMELSTAGSRPFLDGMRYQLREVESVVGEYPQTIGFIALLQQILRWCPAAEELQSPIQPFIKEFVISEVFYRLQERQYTTSEEQWQVAARCLALFTFLVRQFNPESTQNVGGFLFPNHTTMLSEIQYASEYFLGEVLAKRELFTTIVNILYSLSQENVLPESGAEATAEAILELLAAILIQQQAYLDLSRRGRGVPPALTPLDDLLIDESSSQRGNVLFSVSTFLMARSYNVRLAAAKVFRNLAGNNRLTQIFHDQKDNAMLKHFVCAMEVPIDSLPDRFTVRCPLREELANFLIESLQRQYYLPNSAHRLCGYERKQDQLILECDPALLKKEVPPSTCLTVVLLALADEQFTLTSPVLASLYHEIVFELARNPATCSTLLDALDMPRVDYFRFHLRRLHQSRNLLKSEDLTVRTAALNLRGFILRNTATLLRVWHDPVPNVPVKTSDLRMITGLLLGPPDGGSAEVDSFFGFRPSLRPSQELVLFDNEQQRMSLALELLQELDLTQLPVPPDPMDGGLGDKLRQHFGHNQCIQLYIATCNAVEGLTQAVQMALSECFDCLDIASPQCTLARVLREILCGLIVNVDRRVVAHVQGLPVLYSRCASCIMEKLRLLLNPPAHLERQPAARLSADECGELLTLILAVVEKPNLAPEVRSNFYVVLTNYLEYTKIDPLTLSPADAVLAENYTRCNEMLLSRSSARLVTLLQRDALDASDACKMVAWSTLEVLTRHEISETLRQCIFEGGLQIARQEIVQLDQHLARIVHPTENQSVVADTFAAVYVYESLMSFLVAVCGVADGARQLHERAGVVELLAGMVTLQYVASALSNTASGFRDSASYLPSLRHRCTSILVPALTLLNALFTQLHTHKAVAAQIADFLNQHSKVVKAVLRPPYSQLSSNPDDVDTPRLKEIFSVTSLFNLLASHRAVMFTKLRPSFLQGFNLIGVLGRLSWRTLWSRHIRVAPDTAEAMQKERAAIELLIARIVHNLSSFCAKYCGAIGVETTGADAYCPFVKAFKLSAAEYTEHRPVNPVTEDLSVLLYVLRGCENELNTQQQPSRPPLLLTYGQTRAVSQPVQRKQAEPAALHYLNALEFALLTLYTHLREARDAPLNAYVGGIANLTGEATFAAFVSAARDKLAPLLQQVTKVNEASPTPSALIHRLVELVYRLLDSTSPAMDS
eukprot:TRINITY_DN68082_c0_g1_i1.p1 TRINITY_DN68082_c0_g1~~TRINITY_DN68082_c0_g1_i1.p1  ORF type:complete len:1708 (+),score=350.84 TRINITY_DN68082_c0_g1_i1:23-5125(+)